jgi:hypothetical protein
MVVRCAVIPHPHRYGAVCAHLQLPAVGKNFRQTSSIIQQKELNLGNFIITNDLENHSALPELKGCGRLSYEKSRCKVLTVSPNQQEIYTVLTSSVVGCSGSWLRKSLKVGSLTGRFGHLE